MNNYPSWWNQTTTVFNKYENPDTHEVKWFTKTVAGCFWKFTGTEVTLGETTLDTSKTLCRIPKSESFMEKYLWNELSDTDKANYFTLGQGDILVLGDATTETIDEYTKGHRSSDLLLKYRALQGCMQIEKYSLNVDGGRGNEHYAVRGV